MQQALENASGSAGGNCTVIGSSVRLSMTAAARCNAYAGDLFELNDLLGGHASIGNVDAMLSVAEGENSTGTPLFNLEHNSFFQKLMFLVKGRSWFWQ